MSRREITIARRIRSFVDHPVTNLVKGLALMLIGFSDVFRFFKDDASHARIRLGHGLIIIGFFSILGALPNLIESLAVGARLLELREQEQQVRGEGTTPE